MKRSIRLKEHEPDSSREIVPAPQFVARADDSLGSGPFLLRADANGMIVTGNEVVPDAVPVALLGGSFVESSFSAEDERFVSRAERALGGVRFLNGAYSGATSLHLLNTLVNKIFPLVGARAKVIVFVGQSDINVLEDQGTYWAKTQRWAPLLPEVQPALLPDETRESTQKVLRILVGAAQTLGIDLILATSPFREGDFSTDPVLRGIFRRNADRYREVLELRLRLGDDVRAVAEATGTDLMDFQQMVGGRSDWFYDDLHLNPAGQENFAGIFAREVAGRLH